MTIVKNRFKKGIVLTPDNAALDAVNGELKVDSADNKIKTTLGGSPREIVTNDQTQTLSNKTISSASNTLTVNADEASVSNLEVDNLKAGVLDIDLTSVSASDDTIPSAKAVKTYADVIQDNLDDHENEVTDAHDASAISNVPAGNLAATDVQAALNELQGDIDTNATGLSDHLSDAVDAHDASAISSIPSGNLAATDVQTALDELQSDVDTRALDSDLTTHTSASTDVHGLAGGAAVVGTTSTQTLTNKTITGASIQTPTRSDVKQDTKANLITYASTASNGQIVFATDEEKMFQVLDNALVELGAGGGVGSVDIMFADQFDETTIASYSVTGTVDITETAAEVLQGTKTLKITHTGGATAERTVPVDIKFRGKNVTLSLDLASTATSGNLTLSVDDETNTVNLVNTESIQPQESGETSVKRSVSFIIPSDCEELKYSFNAVSESGAISRVDNIVIELTETARLSTTITVPVMTEWVSYSPALVGFGTPTNVQFQYRRVGVNLEVQGKFTSGTSTAVEAQIPIPSGLVLGDILNIPSIMLVGKGTYAHATNFEIQVLATSGDTFLNLGVYNSSGTGVGLTPITGSGAVASGQSISFFASAPIASWEATETQEVSLAQTALVQESDSYIKIDGFLGRGSTNTTVVRMDSSKIRYSLGSDINYVSSATLGDTFTVQSEGIYTVNYSYYGQINLNMETAITKNGTTLTAIPSSISQSEILDQYSSDSDGTSRQGLKVSWTGFLNSGDIIRIQQNTSSSQNANLCQFSMAKQGKLKQLNVSENQKIEIPTSELRFEGASARGGTATAIVKFDNLTKLRGDAFTVVNTSADGTYVTMKKKGKLDISVSLVASSGNSIFVSKNQSSLTIVPTISSEIMSIDATDANGQRTSTSCSVFVNIGDVFRVGATASPIANAGNNLNLSFQEQEVSVSVSNMLPQFTQSDSSVRVDTANGYGSTATKIRRFSNIRDNIGGDITYADSATNGASFTVNSDGVYHISYSDIFNTASGFGVSKNSAELTTDISVLTSISNRLCIEATGGVNLSGNCSWQGSLQAGDIIRAHSDGATSGGTPSRSSFTISKVGKPNITSVDVTPFSQYDYDSKQLYRISQAGNALTNRGLEIQFNLATASITNSGSAVIVASDDTPNTRTKFTATSPCVVNISTSISIDTANQTTQILKNGTVVHWGTQIQSANYRSEASMALELAAGDFFTISCSSGNAFNGADQVYLNFEATETRQAYQVVGGGIENTYSARIAAEGGTPVTTTESYTFISSITDNGVGDYTINFVPGFFTVAPSVTVSIEDDSLDRGVNVYPITTSSVRVRTFIASTGAAADRDFSIMLQRQGSDYRNPSKAIGLNAYQVAYLKDVKASGTAGGTFTSGSYQTRTLNTVEGDTSIVTLAANQFVLSSGVYDIEASASAYLVTGHKLKIYNITDSTDSIIGIVKFDNDGGTVAQAQLAGRIVITSTKTFELRHRSSTTRATDGFGVATTFGDSEVYSIVKITKIS